MMVITATQSKSLAMEGSKSTDFENATVVKKNQRTQSRRNYKTSEKIEKETSEDHPCKLTQTLMKISFPAFRNELFVNIIGYIEPNLVRLNQSKGFCGAPGSSIACMATKMTQKKVSMMLKTNFSGRDSKKQCSSRISAWLMHLFLMNMWSVDASVHQSPDIDALENLITILVSVIVINKDTGKRNSLWTEMNVAVRGRVWGQEG